MNTVATTKEGALSCLIEQERTLSNKIKSLNQQYDRTLLKFINTNDLELTKQLNLLDSKIDCLNRLLDAKTEFINSVMYK